jgi:gas vesicle protein
MKPRKRESLFSVLLDTGLQLVDSLRDRLPDNVDDIKGRVRDTYDTASDRASRAADVLRGEGDSHILGRVGVLLIGVGIGVGIGLLIAPASGEETRTKIKDKVSDIRESA